MRGSRLFSNPVTYASITSTTNEIISIKLKAFILPNTISFKILIPVVISIVASNYEVPLKTNGPSLSS